MWKARENLRNERRTFPPPPVERLGDEFLERGLVADRVEVGVLGGELAKPVRPLERQPQVLDSVLLPAGEALAASEVVERPRILGGLDLLASALDRLRVIALLVEVVQRAPQLPAEHLVRLSGRAPERHDRRARLLRERRSLDARTGEHEGALGRVHLFAVELELCAAALDEVELFLLVVAVRLIVLVDDPVAGLAGRPGVDAEGRDAEVV